MEDLEKQKPFKINVVLSTSEMLGKFILGKLETTEAWIVPIYDDKDRLPPNDKCSQF